MSKFNVICIAGKNRIAIDAVMTARQFFPDDRLFVICNTSDDGLDMWQPSLRKFAQEEGLSVIDLDQAQKMESLLFLSVEFDRLVTVEQFRSSSLLVNMHFSKLPAYKGMYTSCLPILHGAKDSGCTLHQIDNGIDTGEIIAQNTFYIDETDTAKSLYAKYISNGSLLIREQLKNLISGKYSLVRQSFRGSTYFSKKEIDYSNLKINLRVTAEQLNRQVRAFNHRSYQLPVVNGSRISKCVILNDRSIGKPGRVISTSDYETLVSTVDFDCTLIHDGFENAENAVMSDNAEKLKAILGHDLSLASETNARGWSLLARAAYNGCHQTLDVLLKQGADPNIENGKGTTPLMYAKDRFILCDDPWPIQMLVAAGADSDRRDYRNKNVFDYVSDKDKLRLKRIIQ